MAEPASTLAAGPAGSAGSAGSVGTVETQYLDLPDPVRLDCAVVESTFLPLLGVQPFQGRNFTAAEDQPNAAPVGLISYALWHSRFGGGQVLGRFIDLDGKKTEIVTLL